VLVDDPCDGTRGLPGRPLTRVIFDRRLRTPGARVLSTLDAGPVVIVTTSVGAARRFAGTRARRRGDRVAGDGTFKPP
jgi:riboflavin biosynthesis pyrimidine reductase